MHDTQSAVDESGKSKAEFLKKSWTAAILVRSSRRITTAADVRVAPKYTWGRTAASPESDDKTQF